jgi:O-antigen/teichoic acid export membrane protein
LIKQRNLKLVTDFFALSGGQSVSSLSGFLAFAYLARTLSPENYGAVEFAIGLSAIFGVIVEWGTGPIGIRELARAPKRVSVLASAIPASRLAIVCIALPLMGLSAKLSGQTGATGRLVWLYAFGLFALPWKQDWLLQGLEMMTGAAAGQALRSAVFAICVVVFVRASQDLLQVGFAEIVAAGTATLYYLVLQQVRGIPIRLRFARDRLRYLIREGLPIGLTTTAWSFIQTLPVFLITTLSGREQTAWFGASQRIMVSLIVFSQLYHLSLYPAIARRVAARARDLNELVGASFRIVAWSGILLALVLTLLAKPILVLAFGRSFSHATATFSILVWALPVTLLSGHARWSLIASGHQQYVLIANVVGAIAVLGLSAALIPQLGSVGAAIAVVSASLVVWTVAHRYALSLVGDLPIFISALPPGVFAILSWLLAYSIGATPWFAAAIAVLVFALGAPLVDSKLVGDLHCLMLAKADVAEQSRATS